MKCLFACRRFAVQIDDGADGILTDRAKTAAAVKHDALHCGAVVTFGLVIGPFKSADYMFRAMQLAELIEIIIEEARSSRDDLLGCLAAQCAAKRGA